MSPPTTIPRKRRRCKENLQRLSSGELLRDQTVHVCFSKHIQHSRRTLVIFHAIGV